MQVVLRARAQNYLGYLFNFADSRIWKALSFNGCFKNRTYMHQLAHRKILELITIKLQLRGDLFLR